MLLIGLTGSIATGKSTVSALLSHPPGSIPLIDADKLAREVVEPGTNGYDKVIRYFGETTPDLLLPAEPEPEEGVSGDGVEGGGEGRQVRSGKGKGKGGDRLRPLNRAALGRHVFGSSQSKAHDRSVLNGIVHPAVRRAMYRALAYYYVRGHWAVVLDVPLLFESGLDVLCGTVFVVAVKEREVQIQRLLDRDRRLGGELTREEAEGRVLSQWDVREKAEMGLWRNRGLGWRDSSGSSGSGRGVVLWNDAGKEELEVEVGKVIGEIRKQSPQWWSWVCLLAPPVGIVAGLWQVVRNLWDKKSWQKKKRREKSEQ